MIILACRSVNLGGDPSTFLPTHLHRILPSNVVAPPTWAHGCLVLVLGTDLWSRPEFSISRRPSCPFPGPFFSGERTSSPIHSENQRG